MELLGGRPAQAAALAGARRTVPDGWIGRGSRTSRTPTSAKGVYDERSARPSSSSIRRSDGAVEVAKLLGGTRRAAVRCSRTTCPSGCLTWATPIGRLGHGVVKYRSNPIDLLQIASGAPAGGALHPPEALEPPQGLPQHHLPKTGDGVLGGLRDGQRSAPAQIMHFIAAMPARARRRRSGAASGPERAVLGGDPRRHRARVHELLKPGARAARRASRARSWHRDSRSAPHEKDSHERSGTPIGDELLRRTLDHHPRRRRGRPRHDQLGIGSGTPTGRRRRGRRDGDGLLREPRAARDRPRRRGQEDRHDEGVRQRVRRALRELEEVVEGQLRGGAVDRRGTAGHRLARGPDPGRARHAHEPGRARLVHGRDGEGRGAGRTRSATAAATCRTSSLAIKGSLWSGVQLVSYMVAIGARDAKACATTPTSSEVHAHRPGADLRHAVGQRLVQYSKAAHNAFMGISWYALSSPPEMFAEMYTAQYAKKVLPIKVGAADPLSSSARSRASAIRCSGRRSDERPRR